MEQNIYALKGFKIKITGYTDSMYGSGRALAEKHLEIGKIYTVERTEVSNWNTEYYFQEIPDIGFSAFFSEDITVQSEEEDRRHPDWGRYNHY